MPSYHVILVHSCEEKRVELSAECNIERAEARSRLKGRGCDEGGEDVTRRHASKRSVLGELIQRIR